MNYTMKTRKKVELFLKRQKTPLWRGDIQRLGSNHPIIRWDSLNSILADLRKEGRIIFVTRKAGKERFKFIKWKNI